jgi:hypothetical protein
MQRFKGMLYVYCCRTICRLVTNLAKWIIKKALMYLFESCINVMRTNLIKIRLSGATGPTRTALLSEKLAQNWWNWQKWMSRRLWMDSMQTHFISSSWNKPHILISMKWWVLSYVFDVKWHFTFDVCYKKQFMIFEYSWSTPKFSFSCAAKFQIFLGKFRTPFLININTLVTVLL